MSDPNSSLPARPSLEQLRKQAKELLRNCRDGVAVAAGVNDVAFARTVGACLVPPEHMPLQLPDAERCG